MHHPRCSLHFIFLVKKHCFQQYIFFCFFGCIFLLVITVQHKYRKAKLSSPTQSWHDVWRCWISWSNSQRKPVRSVVPTVCARITRNALLVLRSDTDLSFLRKKNAPINHGFIVCRLWIAYLCFVKCQVFCSIDQRSCPIKEVPAQFWRSRCRTSQ